MRFLQHPLFWSLAEPAAMVLIWIIVLAGLAARHGCSAVAEPSPTPRVSGPPEAIVVTDLRSP